MAQIKDKLVTEEDLKAAYDNLAVKSKLTTQDLNAVTTPGFYNADGENTCTNKPSGVTSFGMVVIHSAGGNYYVQLLYQSGSRIAYKRINTNGTWTDWGREVNGVKGNAESEYRTGDVNITPANIGALPISGGTMTGNINMGQSGATSSAKVLRWTTADGTVFDIRPYNNLFQITRKPANGTTTNALGFDSNGGISVENPAGWRSALNITPANIGAVATSAVIDLAHGGTNATTSEAACTNLGAAQCIQFASADTTAALIDAKLSKLALDKPALCRLYSGNVAALTGKTGELASSGGYGTVVKTGTDRYRFNLCRPEADVHWSFSVTVTSSAITPDKVYRYAGTLIS